MNMDRTTWVRLYLNTASLDTEINAGKVETTKLHDAASSVSARESGRHPCNAHRIVVWDKTDDYLQRAVARVCLQLSIVSSLVFIYALKSKGILTLSWSTFA